MERPEGPECLRVSWDAHVARPERRTRQLSEVQSRERPGCQTVWGLANESECWTFPQSDRGSHWRVLSQKTPVV